MPYPAPDLLLERAAPYLRPPPGQGPLELEAGVLRLLGRGPARRRAQKSFDHASIARAYARVRERVLPALFDMPSFEEEAERLRDELDLQPGDVVLDLACGHGNFTEALARMVGPDGLVIGIDIALPMLALAVRRIARAGLGHVLLVHGDAHDLPLEDASLSKLNCSGGLHGMPDVPRALAELRRVAKPGARLTVSMFAEGADDPRARAKRLAKRHFDAHFVPLDWLGRELARVGFEPGDACMRGPWLGYASARLPEAG